MRVLSDVQFSELEGLYALVAEGGVDWESADRILFLEGGELVAS